MMLFVHMSAQARVLGSLKSRGVKADDIGRPCDTSLLKHISLRGKYWENSHVQYNIKLLAENWTEGSKMSV
jgi:hypothetical protein